MKRDFSAGAYNEIVRLISKIESGPGSGITNWYGSGWYEYATWIDSLGIRTHISNVNSYHNTVVARNIAAKNSVDATFNAVGEVDADYGEKLSTINTDLSKWLEYTNQLIQVVNPRNDNFSSNTITTLLDRALVKTVDANAENFEDRFVVEVGDKHLINEENVQAYIDACMSDYLRKKEMLYTMDEMCRWLAELPDLKNADGRIEIPISEELKFYYEVSSSIELNDSVEINLALEDLKAAFDSFTVDLQNREGETAIELEFGDGTIGIGDGNTSIGFDSFEGVVEMSESVEIEDNTYEAKIGAGIMKVVLERSVETKIDGGAITMTAGVEWNGKETNESWTPMKMPASVTSPMMEYEFEHLPALEWTAGSAALSGFICQQPEEEINWIAVGGVVIGCVIVIGGIAYFLYTGGDPLVVEKGAEVVAQNAPKVIEYVVPVVEQIGRAA